MIKDNTVRHCCFNGEKFLYRFYGYMNGQKVLQWVGSKHNLYTDVKGYVILVALRKIV